ncbi:unnamed protein product [Cylicostephanus goldi]|uniref:Ig-like domain-containing protein n=1 Tax=Cylicostephanus goldi TaxID=71465 RepID=A0A3P6SMF2_CYLGO|nr:unnamed protein product [Cylicostephanus goldi]
MRCPKENPAHPDVDEACSAPPRVVISPDEPEYLVSVGDEQVVVRCLGKGNPTPTIKWTRKDGKMPSDITIRGPQLVIAKAKTTHSGEYVCTGTNAAGSDSASLRIQVNGRLDLLKVSDLQLQCLPPVSLA